MNQIGRANNNAFLRIKCYELCQLKEKYCKGTFRSGSSKFSMIVQGFLWPHGSCSSKFLTPSLPFHALFSVPLTVWQGLGTPHTPWFSLCFTDQLSGVMGFCWPTSFHSSHWKSWSSSFPTENFLAGIFFISKVCTRVYPDIRGKIHQCYEARQGKKSRGSEDHAIIRLIKKSLKSFKNRKMVLLHLCFNVSSDITK